MTDYVIEKIKITVNNSAYEVDVSNGAVKYALPASAYDKAISITTITGKKDGNAYNSFSGSFVDAEGDPATPKPPVIDGVFIKVMDSTTDTGIRISITTKFLLDILQQRGISVLWVGVGDAPDNLFDPKATYADGTPLKVTPGLGWCYVDASTGAFWIYDGSAWNDTGEKWTGGFL